ncbi:DUF4013 domain-containing protein [Olsenella sp. HMSC062G07]|uniref:DUF4013 domain-containing protein n=1 Tax=Olsenella sp. HMSC062G07 TaxID=1739330 RepID=UPI0008A39BAC|nr:DUF4013 domain-containing protein [Olsenella sp. HMSC062G07]OFK22263.1 hypothetical protein HMPREF2826_02360 [Olsenella sp. HMSC062G07]
MKSTAYFSHAWSLLTKDKGWFKVLLILMLWSFVPVVGALVVTGYALEWARLVSWNVEGSPKQKNIDVTHCIKSGWRALVVALPWALVAELLVFALQAPFLTSSHPYDDLPLPLTIVTNVLLFLVGVLVAIPVLRATIYQDFKAGFQLNRIAEMIRRDVKGFFRLAGTMALLSICVTLVLAIPALLLLALGAFYAFAVAATVAYHGLSGSMGPLFASLAVFVLLSMLAASFMSLMNYVMVGLWMRQFDVMSWGTRHDPLPPAQTSAQLAASAALAAASPVPGGAQGPAQGQTDAPAGEPPDDACAPLEPPPAGQATSVHDGDQVVDVIPLGVATSAAPEDDGAPAVPGDDVTATAPEDDATATIPKDGDAPAAPCVPPASGVDGPTLDDPLAGASGETPPAPDDGRPHI